MATYYVGIGGNDGNNGSTWALRKLTLTGAEDIPVAANDTVYVGPGVYREMLTLDVSGVAGQPITYIADTTGEHTDGIGGIVRVTGSDNDQTATRANCITGTTRSYRTFRGFAFDTTSSHNLSGGADSRTNWIIEDCTFDCGTLPGGSGVYCNGASQGTWTVRRCRFIPLTYIARSAQFTHNADVSDTAHVVEDCYFGGFPGTASGAVYISNIGGINVRGSTFVGCAYGVVIATALAGGQVVNVNSCVFQGTGAGAVSATVLGELVEDYNAFAIGLGGARLNVAVGANSVTYPPLFDLGVLHSGAGQVSGFRLPQPHFGALSQWSQVRAIADGGTNATLDITGLTRPVTDGKRSWGAVQYQNLGREVTTTHGGSVALRFDDYGRRQFWIPTTGVVITVSVWAYYEADYAGAMPCMIIKQPGQADRVTSQVGAAGAWEELTDTFTPAADTEWVCIELCSLNTDAANPATNDAFFDDLEVTVSPSVGEMETWLWDTEVADWVQAAGGACDYPAEGDVESGVVYGSGAYTGTLICGKRCFRWPDMEICKRRGMP